MFEIISNEKLNDSVSVMNIFAPLVAKKVEPGQFIILRVNETGERIPLTVADFDREAGTITIIFQQIGKTTKLLANMKAKDNISDLVGPLGKPSRLDGYKRACIIGGGVGTAIAYPQAKKLFNMGAEVDIIAGFRSRDIVILEQEMKKVCNNLYITTDDGSYGIKGFVTDQLKLLLESGKEYEVVIAVGPLPMMKFVSELTRKYSIKTVVSLNPIMIDGTGMCGGCRVTEDGKIKFACVDGPEFDGHKIDFDELTRRNNMYKKQELESVHNCRLEGIVNG